MMCLRHSKSFVFLYTTIQYTSREVILNYTTHAILKPGYIDDAMELKWLIRIVSSYVVLYSRLSD